MPLSIMLKRGSFFELVFIKTFSYSTNLRKHPKIETCSYISKWTKIGRENAVVSRGEFKI